MWMNAKFNDQLEEPNRLYSEYTLWWKQYNFDGLSLYGKCRLNNESTCLGKYEMRYKMDGFKFKPMLMDPRRGKEIPIIVNENMLAYIEGYIMSSLLLTGEEYEKAMRKYDSGELLKDEIS